eukprot:gnl/TRDRNA2_/TRDRNA2_205965_c0_seq1.p1 gnl/TRDRNA2_/TRDRNA2_205965_c0~~gnl/TRDRNA2_/TRDRNA2_205965_c0_seq1.p1  ORF type:complete len:325 (-),score=28.27 gnl/TRDRNA2_/TRDRNA2_205965_c0_seq1:48-1022(-)
MRRHAPGQREARRHRQRSCDGGCYDSRSPSIVRGGTVCLRSAANSRSERRCERRYSRGRNRDSSRSRTRTPERGCMFPDRRPAVTLKSKSDGCNARRRVFFIGIAGPSGVGKTTLAKRLVNEWNSPVISIGMDWFLMPKWMPKDPQWGKNWETPDGVDFGRLCKDLAHARDVLSQEEVMPEELLVGGENIVRQGQAGRWLGSDDVIVIADGFLLFYDVSVANSFDAHVWVETDCDTCMVRRHQRGRGSRKKEVETSADWYRCLVWTHHEKHRRTQLENAAHALRLDGSKSTTDLLDKTMDHCKGLLSKTWGRGAARHRMQYERW